MADRECVLAALAQVIDPDFQQDIVSLGFIKDLDIDGGAVSFAIELTTPACPIKDQFEARARDLVAALPGVDKVSIHMTARQRPDRKLAQGSGLKEVTSLLAISSCKGGVGKSTVAALLARVLANRGLRVGFLDADLFGPSAPTLFNLHGVGVEADADNYIIPRESGGLSVVSFGFMAGEAPAVMRGPMVSGYIQQLLHQVAWGPLDILIIDMPPGTGDVQLTLAQSVQLDAAVIVTTPHQLSLADVRKGIMMFEKVNVPVVGVIENMAYFECDGCNKRHEVFGASSAASLEEEFGLPKLAEFPVTPPLGESIAAFATTSAARDATDHVVRALGRQSLKKQEKPAVTSDATAIRLTWADGSVTQVANRDLRLACRCALCVDEMSHQPVLDPASVPAAIHAEELRLIGNYALGVTWSDGHSTGFFPYKAIRSLAAKAAS